MTKTEFEKTYDGNLTKEHLEKYFPPQRTFNGICFKLPISNLKEVNEDTIVYVGEFAYTDGLDRICTAKDILETAKEYAPKDYTQNQIDDLADFIFDVIDWQSPESFANEIEF